MTTVPRDHGSRRPPPVRHRRRHPAASARRTATGLGVCATVVVAGALGLSDRPAPAPAPTSPAGSSAEPSDVGPGAAVASDDTWPGTAKRPAVSMAPATTIPDGVTHGSR